MAADTTRSASMGLPDPLRQVVWALMYDDDDLAELFVEEAVLGNVLDCLACHTSKCYAKGVYNRASELAKLARIAWEPQGKYGVARFRGYHKGH